jgi:cell wall assembly regulator SMI1
MESISMSKPVVESWQQIVDWLGKNAAETVALLQKPVSAETISRAEARVGFQLPEELKSLYLLCNGNDPHKAATGIYPSVDDYDEMAYGPLALEQALSEWEIQKELLEGGDFEGEEPESEDGVADVWWHVGWFPFGSNGGGDLYCVDTAPDEGGTIGQVISHSHETGERKILARSIGEYLSKLAEGLAAGQLEYDEDCGLQTAE